MQLKHFKIIPKKKKKGRKKLAAQQVVNRDKGRIHQSVTITQ